VPLRTPEHLSIEERLEALTAMARAKAKKAGLTPVGPVDFARIIGLHDNQVKQWRSDLNTGNTHNGRPTPEPPGETWLLSDNRPAWATAICEQYGRAYQRGDKKFTADLELDPDLEPLGEASVAILAGARSSNTVVQWVRRGVIPEPTWTVSGSRVWARCVIEAWLAARNGAKSDRVQTSSRSQAQMARLLVERLKELNLIDVDVEAHIVTIRQGAVVPVTEIEAVALDAI
jgi:hypothetical protein